MNTTSLSWSWDSSPELNEPSLKSPRPCSHGSNCLYDSCCAFVHPGEEGTERKLFPARTVNKDDGVQAWEPAVVRLVGYARGQAGFYERRRLRMSWSAWCKRVGLPIPVRVSAQPHKRRQAIDLGETGIVSVSEVEARAPSWADVARGKEEESAPAPTPAPSPVPAPLLSSVSENWGDMMMGYEAPAPAPVVEEAPVPAPVVEEAPVPVPAPAPSQQEIFYRTCAEFNANIWLMQQKLSYAQTLFPVVASTLDAGREVMNQAGLTHPLLTASFLTTYLISRGTLPMLNALVYDSDYFTNSLFASCEFINTFPRA